MKKIEKRRDSNYYIEILETILMVGEASGIKTNDFYAVVDMVDKKLGYNPAQGSKILDKVKSLLGERVTVVVDVEEKKVGRSKPEIITFHGSIEELKEKVLSAYSKMKSEAKKKSPKSEKKVTGRDTYRTRPTEASVKKLYDILSLYVNRGETFLGFYKIKEALGFEMNGQVMKNITGCLKKYGYRISYGIGDIGAGKRALKIDSAESALLELSIKYKIWFGIEKSLEVEKLLGISKAVKLPKAKKIEVGIESSSTMKQEQEHILYYLAGLIKSNDGRAVDKTTIISGIRKNLRYDIGTSELLALVKKEPEFSIVRTDQERVAFSNNPESWKVIRSKYGPEKTKKEILIRVNMSMAELQQRLGEDRVTLESAISGDDNIYKITADYSRTFFHKLMNLYRTFRGTDKILNDEALVNDLAKQILDADAAYNRVDMLYQLEIM